MPTSSTAASARQEASILLDYRSGEVLAARNADDSVIPASLTKMMTLYLTFRAVTAGQLDLSSRIKVSSRAAGMPPTKLGLRAGDTIRVEDAIMGLVTRSANDAATVLAEALGGSEDRFAMAMTRTARKLGMTRTVFRNASGLPDGEQRTTARDLALSGFASDQGLSWLLSLLLKPGLCLSRPQPPEPQPAPSGLPRDGRSEDRLHPCFGLQPGGVRRARRPQAGGGGDRRSLGQRA